MAGKTDKKENMVEFGLTPQLPYSIEEAVNRLRINISFLGSDVRKILIVSSEPNEGKSFIALNLWNQMAAVIERKKDIEMAFKSDNSIKPFEKKIWLSSPTMHGDELKYMQEAYETRFIWQN